MRRLVPLVIALFSLANAFSASMMLDVEKEKKSFGTKITISPMDKTVTVTKNKIVIKPASENVTYTISGYFNGQIVNKTKNTILKLKNAYIENTSGEPAIYGDAKTEISTTKDTSNYVVSSGKAKSGAKVSAIECRKNLVLGGSGKLSVKGTLYHAVKADDVKIKGSGVFFFEATDKGSCINCHSLAVEKDKTFAAYFLNSKNAVKADNTILIQSGDFFIYDNATAFKTDTKKDDPKNPHSVTLSGGTIRLRGNKSVCETEKDSYKVNGAVLIEE